MMRRVTKLRGKMPLNSPSPKVERHDTLEAVDKDNSHVLCISNLTSRYQLHHGKEFRQLFEARDQVLEHQFQFNFHLDDIRFIRGQDFLDCELYIEIKKSMRKFIGESVGNVMSVGVNFVNKKDLGEDEAREFICENVLVNVQSIFRHTIAELSRHEMLKDKIKVDQLKDDLAVEVDMMVRQTLAELKGKYPKEVLKGCTMKVKKEVREMDKTCEEQNDLIYLSNLSIDRYVDLQKDENGNEKLKLSQNGDYTEYIMTVLNQVIEVTKDIQSGCRDQTNYDIFVDFTQKIVGQVLQIRSYSDYEAEGKLVEKFKDILGNTKKEVKKKEDKKEKKEKKKKEAVQAPRQDFNQMFLDSVNEASELLQNGLQNPQPGEGIGSPNFLQRINDLNARMMQNMRRQQQGDRQQVEDQEEDDSDSDDSDDQDEEQNQDIEINLEEIKVRGDLSTEQKIHQNVRPFTAHEIQNKRYLSADPSLLVVMAKWAEHLEFILKNPEQLVKQKQRSFKNIQNQIVNLYEGKEEEHRRQSSQKLVKRLYEGYKEVKKRLKCLLKTSYRFLGKCLSKLTEQDFASSISRYTDVRRASGELNSLLTSLFVEYLNILIHQLLKAGEHIWTKQQQFLDLNLVNLGVTDILKSKVGMSEDNVMALLQILTILDASEVMEQRFKIVKIENNVGCSGTILVNYLLMNGVQCQLILSITGPNQRQRSLHMFNDLICELSRASFGPLTECSILMSRLTEEPSSDIPVQNKQDQNQMLCSLFRQKKGTKSSQVFNLEENKSEVKTTYFQCSCCRKMAVNQENDNIFSKDHENCCWECLIKKNRPEQYLIPQFQDIFEPISDKRLTSYQCLAPPEKPKYLVCLNIFGSGQVTLKKVVFFQKEMETVIMDICPIKLEIIELERIAQKSLVEGDCCSVGYFDIAKENGPLKDKHLLMYVFQESTKIPEKVLAKAGFKNQPLQSLQKLSIYEQIFKDHKRQRVIINMLKSKKESIKVEGQESKILNNVCKALVMKQTLSGKNKLKCRKYKNLDIEHLRELTIDDGRLNEIPKWLVNCGNLQKLKLTKCDLKGNIDFQFPPNLVHLNLQTNFITSIQVSELEHLTYLNVSKNQIEEIDVSKLKKISKLIVNDNRLSSLSMGSNKIKHLWINQNSGLKELKELPEALQVLFSDKAAIISYDFEPMKKLTTLRVYNGATQRSQIINLDEDVTFSYGPW